jgi:hypothetical protein
MGYMLRRMIRDGAPAEWSPLMRLVASEIADDAHDPGPEKDALPAADNWPHPWSAMPVEGEWRRGEWRDGLAERCGMSARAISRALADLAEAGYDMRSPITGRDGHPVRDKRGRLVYAAKGHAVRFTVPYLPPRPSPQRSPESASIGDWLADGGNRESSPNLASIEPQRSPLLVSKVAESGDPVSSTSPKFKTSPQKMASRRVLTSGSRATRSPDQILADVRQAITREHGQGDAGELTDGQVLGLYFAYGNPKTGRVGDLVAYLSGIFSHAAHIDTFLANAEPACVPCWCVESDCQCEAA